MSDMRNTGSDSDLKALRESRGLTIEAIFNVTKVRPAFLEAIENGNFQILPERIYSEAFIKSYAVQIGANPEDILARYRSFLKLPDPGKVPEKKSEKKAEKRKDEGGSGPEVKKPEGAKSPETLVVKSPLSNPKKKFSRVAISLLLTVLVVCGGFLYFLLSDNDSGPEVLMKAEKPAAPAQPAPPSAEPKPADAPQQPAADQSGITAAGTTPAGTTPAAPADAKPATAVSNKLIVHANELTWISVTEDGSQQYQIMLRPGDNLERTAGNFMLDIGNAGGIVINFNGKDMGVPGRSGQVVHMILPQEEPKE
jgi:cytoskeletal protein RodZ